MSDRSDDTGPVPEVSASDGAETAPSPGAEDGVPDHDALGHNALDGPAAEPITAEPQALEAPAWVETAEADPASESVEGTEGDEGDEGPAVVTPTVVTPAAQPPADDDATAVITPPARFTSTAAGEDQNAVAPAAAPVPVPFSEAEHTALLEHPNGGPFLHAQGLSAHGRQGPIFTDVTLTANLGQVVAICGDGGDGRSSLLLALTGRFAVQNGTLEVDGQTRPGQIRRRFTIAQAGPPIRFDPYHTVASCISETITVSKGAATRANINAWLDRLLVGVDTGDTFGFLPRIDQIRFAIACAAACRTPAIAVDDIDSGLDTCGAERVFEALRTVADAGQLVIAACTRSDPPADAVVDLRGQHPSAAAGHRDDHAAPRRHRREADRTGGHL